MGIEAMLQADKSGAGAMILIRDASEMGVTASTAGEAKLPHAVEAVYIARPLQSISIRWARDLMHP